ncbi:multicopper oxidase family protein [Primorskyibacter aestuariivivens]|uniref:multicopper oxidase family protein n=1 Tax=Primorskyibacter aestuariivivens TaxID=1888912 RepID=UPI002300D558|nr:multicopper oxidase family protein [Primorskyibacter aestuariivivens]MDA7430404.1 multicopper oxidase family protein [Primorskyibacter aestuariivivens]
MLSRRAFLGSALSITALPALATPRRSLTAGPSRHQIAPADYPDTALWTFNGTFPGEALRFAQGERLDIRVKNDLPQATSVHWHGLRLPNAMDGVPGLTQPPIETGQSFDYAFDLKDAGTYWYHSHAQSVEQVERGLYGPLIIDEPERPDVNHDLTLVLDDIRLVQDASISEDFDNRHDGSHAGRMGNLILTNGMMDARFDVKRGERLRLRLINAANARVFQLGLQGLEGWVVALDGMPLQTPERPGETFALAPAQRMDLIVDVVAEDEAFLVQYDRSGGYAQATFHISGRSEATRPAPDALPPNEVHALEIDAARSVPLRMEGGAMRGLQSAVYQGEDMGMRDLASRGMFWAFNGAVGRQEAPLIEAALGETVRVPMINDTAFPHAMHLHGHHFQEVTEAGMGPLRDTLLVNPGETREVAFNAHNPGDWLFHCHMLSHHAAGMGTWIRVRA